MPSSRPLVTGLRLGRPDLRPVVSRIAVPGAGSPRQNSARTTGLNTYFAVPLASLRFVSRRFGTGTQPIARAAMAGHLACLKRDWAKPASDRTVTLTRSGLPRAFAARGACPRRAQGREFGKHGSN